jgi:hypothetical protein
MKARILSLALAVAAVGIVGCNNPSTTPNRYGETGAGSTATGRPIDERPVTKSPDTTVPAPVATPSESKDTQKEQLQTSADQAKVQRDKIFDEVYRKYLQSSAATDSAKKDAEQGKLDVPSAFKSHCTSIGKGNKVMSTDDKVKAFFAQSDVQQKCAEAYRLDQQASETHKQK